MKTIFPISFLLLFALISCKDVSNPKIRKNWTTIEITSDWLIDVPRSFKRQEFPGIDSEIGSIYSKKDSINLEFESWRGRMDEGSFCEFENQNKRLNQEIKNLRVQYSKNDYVFIIENINKHLALIIYPKDGDGVYRLEIQNCEVGNNIVIHGPAMNNQKMILEIFRSIRFQIK